MGAGLLAAATFRALRRSATATVAPASEARGRIGRVILAIETGQMGKVRVELAGQSVDFVATADEALGRGEEVLVVDVRGEVVHVARRPSELA